MKIPGFLRALLSRRDFVYLLNLLVPFVVYNLALEASDVASLPGEHGFFATLGLTRSDLFFNAGYVLFWIGLFTVAREGFSRRIAIVLFHATTMLVVLVTTCAHLYIQETGTAPDYDTLVEWIPKLGEVSRLLFQGVPFSPLLLLEAALLYAALGPLIVTRIAERWVQWPENPQAERPAQVSFLGSLGLCFLALGVGSLSLLGSDPTDTKTSLATDSFVNVVLTGFDKQATEKDEPDADPAVEHPAADTSLAETPLTEKRNVVLVHLESTRAQSTTPYNKDLETTPFLDELAKSSLLAEQAHVVLPRSSKGSVAVNCGIEPALYPGPEFEPGGLPSPCLADLLKNQGYNTVFFQSTSNSIDDFNKVVTNLGYEDFYSSESMDTEGFQATNSFGYEDDIMLKPSEQWLESHKNQPFMAEYLTGTGHYGYQCLGTRYGTKDFADDDQLNRYLNCLRLQDIFLENLMDQYKQLGFYDNTIFVIFGDHGEGLGEHGRFMHGDTPYEEGIRIPLIIHAPGWFDDGQRAEGLSNETDILPTILDMLGYEVKGGQYPGYSLLHPLPEDRTLMFSCISGHECLASMKGTEKYIYHYDKQPDEVFNLSKDPLEERNLAALYSEEALDKRREELLAWRMRVNASYGPILLDGTLYSERDH